MEVDFNTLDFIKVYIANFTRGNISTRAFQHFLDKVEGAENIPAPIERALKRKAEKHTDLKLPLYAAFHHRNDKIRTAKFVTQQVESKKNEMTHEQFINKAHHIAKNLVDASGITFRLTVAAYLKPHDMDHASTNETHDKLIIARDGLKEKQQSLEAFNAKVKQETSMLTPTKENTHANFIEFRYGKFLEEKNNLIEKNTAEVADLKNKKLQQKKIFIQTIIDLVENKPSIINETMMLHFIELRRLHNLYNAQLASK